MRPLFNQHCRSSLRRRGCNEHGPPQLVFYGEVSRRSPPMVEVVEKDWLDGRLVAKSREWGLPSSTISPRQRTRSLANVDNVETRCEMTISVDAVRPWRIFPRTTLSEEGSRQEVASSNIKIRGCCRIALAMASRWR